jgi:hypothetical protein
MSACPSRGSRPESSRDLIPPPLDEDRSAQHVRWAFCIFDFDFWGSKEGRDPARRESRRLDRHTPCKLVPTINRMQGR